MRLMSVADGGLDNCPSKSSGTTGEVTGLDFSEGMLEAGALK